MGATIPGSDSIRVQTEVVSTDSVTENPAKLVMVFDHYIRMKDGRVRYSDLCHTEIITDTQFQVVVNGLKALTVDAAHRDNLFYSKIQGLTVGVRAQKLGIKSEELVKQLDEKVPGYNVTYRELNQLMKPSKDSDFVPRELHLGFNPPLGGILGVTWLNTGVIYYNPDAWITDALNSIPKVMQHEMVHGNINVEKWPMSAAFDVELMASLPEMLYLENTTDFPSHGYAADIRELAQIYYGMDWAEMRKQIVKMDFAGNIVYDDEKYVYYYKQIDQIKVEMMKFFVEVTIPEFYSDPVWWSANNDGHVQLLVDGDRRWWELEHEHQDRGRHRAGRDDRVGCGPQEQDGRETHPEGDRSGNAERRQAQVQDHEGRGVRVQAQAEQGAAEPAAPSPHAEVPADLQVQAHGGHELEPHGQLQDQGLDHRALPSPRRRGL